MALTVSVLPSALAANTSGRPEFEPLRPLADGFAGVDLRQQGGDEFRLGGGVEQRALARAAAHGSEHARRPAVDIGVARPADGQRQEIATDALQARDVGDDGGKAVVGVLDADCRRNAGRERTAGLVGEPAPVGHEMRQHLGLEGAPRPTRRASSPFCPSTSVVISRGSTFSGSCSTSGRSRNQKKP